MKKFYNLGPNYLTLKEFFEKVNLKKKAGDKNHEKIPTCMGDSFQDYS